MSQPPLSRRARYRAETHAEAEAIALRQLAEGGIGAVSLNAIGKEMGVTGEALYRYFESRDALLSSLIMDGYRDLATAVEVAAQQHQPGTPRECLRALAAVVGRGRWRNRTAIFCCMGHLCRGILRPMRQYRLHVVFCFPFWRLSMRCQ